jgi:hypothetical protein
VDGLRVLEEEWEDCCVSPEGEKEEATSDPELPFLVNRGHRKSRRNMISYL